MQHPLVRTAPIPVSSKRPTPPTTPDVTFGRARIAAVKASKVGSIKSKALSQDSLAELEAGRRAMLLDDLTPEGEYDPTSWRTIGVDSDSEVDSTTTEEEDEAEATLATNSPILRSLVEVPSGSMDPIRSQSTTRDMTISLTTDTWSLTFSSTNLLLHENLLHQLPALVRSLHLTQLYNNN